MSKKKRRKVPLHIFSIRLPVDVVEEIDGLKSKLVRGVTLSRAVVIESLIRTGLERTQEMLEDV
jgi:hypothetical protein